MKKRCTHLPHQSHSDLQNKFPAYAAAEHVYSLRATQVQHRLLIFLWEAKRKGEKKKSFTLFIEFVAEISVSLQEHTCKSPQTGF